LERSLLCGDYPIDDRRAAFGRFIADAVALLNHSRCLFCVCFAARVNTAERAMPPNLVTDSGEIAQSDRGIDGGPGNAAAATRA
jgi:hypothetical protein